MGKNKTDKNKMDKKVYKNMYKIILLIAIICFILSIIIYYEKNSYNNNTPSICSAITNGNGCGIVQTSKYSEIFGVSNPFYGMAGFGLLIIFTSILLFKGNSRKLEHIKMLHYLTIIGCIIAGIMAIYFLALQVFIIHAYCIFCIMVDVLSIAIACASIYTLIVHKAVFKI